MRFFATLHAAALRFQSRNGRFYQGKLRTRASITNSFLSCAVVAYNIIVNVAGYVLVQPVVRGIQSQGVIANVKHYVRLRAHSTTDTWHYSF